MSSTLKHFTDEELVVIVLNSGFERFLEPIKKNPKRYLQFNPFLGTKDVNSNLVQKNLPAVVLKLFHSADEPIVRVMEECAQEIADKLIYFMNSTLKREVSIEEIMSFSDEEIADIINEFLKVENNTFDPLLFCVQMKLIGCTEIDKRIDNIKELCGIDELWNDDLTENDESDEDTENKDADESKPLEKKEQHKTKHKKLTPQEKAARNKAALEAKAKAKAEEKNVNKKSLGLSEEKEQEPEPEIETKNSKEELKADFHIENQKEETVSRLIGVISIISNYYNFIPIGRYENGSYDSFSEIDIDDLIPNSQRHNINFYYNLWNDEQVKFVNSHYYENHPIILNCDIDELEENRMPDGTLNPTGYKYPAVDGYKKGKICSMSDAGLYTLLSLDDLIDDYRGRRVVRIKGDELAEGDKVLVNLKDGFYAGPFTIKYSPTNYTYYITMQAEEGKHYVSGYRSTDCKRVEVEPSMDVEEWIGYNKWVYYILKNNAQTVFKDCISDKDLLEALKEVLEKSDGLDYSNLDINGIMDKLDTSLIIGKSLPDEIKKQRLDRIKTIMSDEENLKQILSEASDVIYDLLINNKESMQTEMLITEMFEKRPDLLEKVQSVRAVQSKLDSARAELEDLRAQKEKTTEEIRTIKTEEAMKSRSDDIIDTITVEISDKRNELNNMLERLGVVKEAVDLQDKVKKLKEEAGYYEKHKEHLQNDAKNLEKDFIDLINNYSEKMADITFDGFMSSKMLQAAAAWEDSNDKNMLYSLAESINDIEVQESDSNSTVDYIVNIIKTVRPGYSKNDIINIMICAVQGFLTVFSGAPGCGKTSICNILAKTLGLNNYEKISEDLGAVKRYIPVSVERGWTSKRDLIGYFNPLTKAFEESNKEVFDGLRLLDVEYNKKYNKWPFYILLDEANLSPMEYYWADFMNVCDDRNDNCSVNLGNNNVFKIPETLHFLATINNDHTTETLSPRLIDRAWVVTLPRVSSIISSADVDEGIIKNISWTELKNAFDSDLNEKKNFDREAKTTYEGIKEKLSKQGIFISPRVDRSILKYWITGSTLMEEDEYGNPPSLIALDYAVSQKILPKIVGAGEEYELWLEDLKNYCDNKNLTYTVDILTSIIERGNRRMKYYQFFD